MFIHPLYKKIKEQLAATAVPVFYYIGQYQPGKANTSYLVPAIYIEMPANTPLVGQNLLTKSKGAIIKVHYISYAPFKNHTNDIQETAIAQHEEKLKAIDKLLNKWNAKFDDGENMTEQMLLRGSELNKFQGMSLISVLHYQQDIYSRHLTD